MPRDERHRRALNGGTVVRRPASGPVPESEDG